MSNVLIASEPPPPWAPSVSLPLLRLLLRSAAMGVLAGATVTALDAAAVQQLVQGLQRHGIAGDAAHGLAVLMQPAAGPLAAADERRVAATLARLSEALEDSAAPAAEWPAMRTVFGDDLLGTLLEVSPASLRRYAEGSRTTPDAVAARLHWLALVVGDLAGAYNDHGMRRWFDRPRAALGGLSPRTALGRGWSPDTDTAARVRALAAPLTGAQPLA